MKVLRAVPAPVTDAYLAGLRKRILATAGRKQHIVNCSIVGCISKSLLGVSRPFSRQEREKKCAKLLEGVAAVASRAVDAAASFEAHGNFAQAMEAMWGPGMAKDPYLAKCFSGPPYTYIYFLYSRFKN